MNQDELKRLVGRAALAHVSAGAVIGVGTGSTVDCFIDALAAGGPRIAGAVSSSLRSTARLEANGIRVFEADAAAPPWLPDSPGYLRLASDAERAARSALERAVSGHPGAEVAFLAGDPARELMRETEISDLLVIGSRSYGPDGVVVLGGVNDEVLRTASCPVLIVPTGVELTDEFMLDPEQSTSAIIVHHPEAKYFNIE